MRIFQSASLALLLWTVGVGGYTALRLIVWAPMIAPQENVDAFIQAAEDQIRMTQVSSVSFVLIEDGKVVHESHMGIDPPSSDSIYQMASVSKLVTAWGVMNLVEEGLLDLDTPIGSYLTRWQLPASDVDLEGVTVRRLLSHTAGLTDGLGYAGVPPDEPIQTLEQSLNAPIDPMPGVDGEIVVGLSPGEQWRYSGGGYTILQLLVEEVTEDTFAEYMSREVLRPLSMSDATFVWDDRLQPRFVPLYDSNGEIDAHYRYTAQAAASLYATPADMTAFALAQLGSEASTQRVLSAEAVATMREPILNPPSIFGNGWGLGYQLYAPTLALGNHDLLPRAERYVVGHEGRNRPAINHTLRVNPYSRDGIVLLVSGDWNLGTDIGDAWTTWNTGIVTNLDFLEPVMWVFGVGGVMIIITFGLIYKRRKRG